MVKSSPATPNPASARRSASASTLSSAQASAGTMLATSPAFSARMERPAGMDTSPPSEPFWAMHTGKPQSGTSDSLGGSSCRR